MHPQKNLNRILIAASFFLISYFTFSGPEALRGVEFAVVTLAVSVALERLANAGGSVTGGQNGILITHRLGPFHRGHAFYLLAALVLVGIYIGVKRVLGSRSGLVFRGVGQNEERVESLGYNVPRVKRWIFALSGAVAGLAGGLFYLHEGIVSPAAVGVGASSIGDGGAPSGIGAASMVAGAASAWLSARNVVRSRRIASRSARLRARRSLPCCRSTEARAPESQ